MALEGVRAEYAPERPGFRTHARIVWALLLRELATRYGRNNIGFLWVIAEPLLFCGAVLILWSIAKPPFEHGIRIAPFVVTGYMPIVLVRHLINYSLHGVRANAGLLYHRRITLLHVFIARGLLEIIGVSMAFVVVVTILAAFGLMEAPRNLGLVYAGWFLLAWIAFGLGLIMGAAAELVSIVERFVAALTYVLVPLSGTFYMASWLPPRYRELVLYLPFLHPVEMIRGGFFGEAVQAYYDPGYAALWAAIFSFAGLLLLRFVRHRVEVE